MSELGIQEPEWDPRPGQQAKEVLEGGVLRVWVTGLLAFTPDKRLWAWDLPPPTPTPSLCLSISTLGGSQAFPVPDLSYSCRLCMNAHTPGRGGP